MLILRTKVRCEIDDFDAICVLLSQPPGGLSFVLLFHALFRSNTHVLCIPLMCCYELVFKIISIPFLIISVILIRLFQFNSIVFPIPLTQRSILSSSIFLTSSILSSSIFSNIPFCFEINQRSFFITPAFVFHYT